MVDKKENRRIWIRMALFALSFVLLNGLISAYFLTRSVKNFKVVRQDQKFWKNYDDQQVLILGHSRSFRALDPEIINSSIRFCSGSETIVKSYFKLKYLLEQGHRPSYVICPADYIYFSLDKPGYDQTTFYWRKYVDYLELGELLGRQEDFAEVHYKSRFFPYHKYPYLLLLKANKEHLVRSPKLYDDMGDEEKKDVATRLVEHQARAKYLESAVARNYLKRTIDLAGKHHVELIFVFFPLTPEYRVAYETNAERQGLEPQKSIEQIKSFLGDGVHLVDARSDMDDCPTCFKDIHHLSDEGSSRFSRRINALIQELDQARPSP